jgi:Amt family ammonium transporter
MGFNPGSTLGATDLRISVVAVNTNLAAVAGSAAAMLIWYFLFGKPDITMACNGMLAGLVAITAPCAFVSPTSSVIIEVLAGALVCGGVLFNERVLRIDDPCGAISEHGFCGWLGAVFLWASLPTEHTAQAGMESERPVIRGTVAKASPD